MSAAHLLIAAAGGLPEAGEGALQPRASYTPSPERSSFGEASPARRPSQDAPASVWASPEEQRRLSGQQEPPLRSQGSAGHGESARRSSASQVQSGSEDEGEVGLRLEDLLSGGSSECFASPSAAPPLWALLQFGYSRVSLKILEAFQYQVLAWRCMWARQHTVTSLLPLKGLESAKGVYAFACLIHCAEGNLCAASAVVDLEDDEDEEVSSSLEGSQASGGRRAWAGPPSAMEGLSMAGFKASANKTSKQCASSCLLSFRGTQNTSVISFCTWYPHVSSNPMMSKRSSILLRPCEVRK